MWIGWDIHFYLGAHHIPNFLHGIIYGTYWTSLQNHWGKKALHIRLIQGKARCLKNLIPLWFITPRPDLSPATVVTLTFYSRATHNTLTQMDPCIDMGSVAWAQDSREIFMNHLSAWVGRTTYTWQRSDATFALWAKTHSYFNHPRNTYL